ncbi:PIP5K2 [Symbiodinium natans]|uniref:PIP5K2 protein n=1 Tax=Symbiodinium natans TaxID=878477 RepID=A0A812TEV6_9DINO|nr:PIP5K2 [Symbiodinium natans]
MLLVEAPPGFTYICPLSPTVYMPDYSIALPSDVTCNVDHNTLANRNKLFLELPSGLQGDTRYAFTIDVVNARFIDPLRNFFRMATMLDGEACAHDISRMCIGIKLVENGSKWFTTGIGKYWYHLFTLTRSCCGSQHPGKPGQADATVITLVLCAGHGQARTCSSLQQYVEWALQWTSSCRPTGSTNFSWFSSCSWIECDCLWGALSVPVATDELAPCLEESVVKQLLDQETKWFLTSLFRTCRSQTDELSKPCGKCDKYRDFHQCGDLV